MDSRELVDELRRKYQEPNNKLLAKHLGVSYALINKWHTEPQELSVKQIVNLIDKAKKQSTWLAHNSSIRPIVEYYPIEAEESKHGTCWELFNAEVSGNRRQEGLKEALTKAHGVYVFLRFSGRSLVCRKSKGTESLG